MERERQGVLCTISTVLFVNVALIIPYVYSSNEISEITQQLSQLYADYRKVKTTPTIRDLVLTDQRLRKLEEMIRSEYERPDNQVRTPDYQAWADVERASAVSYVELGLHVGHWSQMLEYSGRMLTQAHKMNPHSEYRAFTLFSSLCGGTGRTCWGPPDLRAAVGYAKEFPKGPFIDDTLWMMASFYKDLFMVLRDNHLDYKYDCYRRYINNTSRRRQMLHAKARAISYYQQFLRRNPKDVLAATRMDEVKRETVNAWTFCPD